DEADRADPVRAVAVLEAADQLAFDHRQHRHDQEDAEKDDDGLDDHHPGGLGVIDVGERWLDGQAHRFSTPIARGTPSASRLALPSSVPSIRNAAPSRMRSRIATVASTLWPLTETVTESPLPRSRLSASFAWISSLCFGIRNRRAGFRFVTSAAQRS